MDFLRANFINTTTQLAVNSNTLTQSNIFNSDIRRQYFSEGFNNDLTTTTIMVSFDETLSVSRIALMEANFKALNIFYNGLTANTFSFTSTSATITSQWSANSETSLYLEATAVNVTSVTFDFKSTQVANSEKAVGFIVLSNVLLNFERVPSAGDYKPKLKPKEVIHKLSDGGVRTHFVENKFETIVKFKHITETFRDNLKTVYDLHQKMIFVPFGTSTSWDKILYESVWTGSFDFFKYSDNAQASGFSGTLKIMET